MGRIVNLLRNINYLSKHSLWDRREEDIVFFTNKILDDAAYEFGVEPLTKKLDILSPIETIKLIKNKPKSFLRTGDGELKLIKGLNQPFQKYESEIAIRLKEALAYKRDDVYIGVNGNYYNPNILNGRSDYIRRWAFEYRKIYSELCESGKTYIDATCTALMGRDMVREEINERINLWQELIKGKDIALVCGKGLGTKYKYNIFENASSFVCIEGPLCNAWDEKDAILNKIYSTVSKKQILVFVLGMAGKAMIPEITEKGYICWDFGHLPKAYDAYMRGVEWTEDVVEKFVRPD